MQQYDGGRSSGKEKCKDGEEDFCHSSHWHGNAAFCSYVRQSHFSCHYNCSTVTENATVWPRRAAIHGKTINTTSFEAVTFPNGSPVFEPEHLITIPVEPVANINRLLSCKEHRQEAQAVVAALLATAADLVVSPPTVDYPRVEQKPSIGVSF